MKLRAVSRRLGRGRLWVDVHGPGRPSNGPWHVLRIDATPSTCVMLPLPAFSFAEPARKGSSVTACGFAFVRSNGSLEIPLMFRLELVYAKDASILGASFGAYSERVLSGNLDRVRSRRTRSFLFFEICALHGCLLRWGHPACSTLGLPNAMATSGNAHEMGAFSLRILHS